ncbi:MAG: hypothetical protein FMNOHCHN_03871 [Ignavibacteriaceae bacterium]|nr:hypothetical protein [Ignavibacteriaceae bacterium]
MQFCSILKTLGLEIKRNEPGPLFLTHHFPKGISFTQKNEIGRDFLDAVTKLGRIKLIVKKKNDFFVLHGYMDNASLTQRIYLFGWLLLVGAVIYDSSGIGVVIGWFCFQPRCEPAGFR